MTTISGPQQLAVLLRAKYPIIGIQTREELRVERAIAAVAKTGQEYAIRYWSTTTGLTERPLSQPLNGSLRDPVEALDHLLKRGERALYILRDLHEHIRTDSLLRRKLRDVAREFRVTPPAEAKALLLISPAFEVPADLESAIYLLDWPLPTREDVGAVLDQTVKALADAEVRKAAQAVDQDRLIAAALGLTTEEAFAAFSRSLVEHKTLDPGAILQEKRQIVQKAGIGLEWLLPLPGGLNAVGGLADLKAWLIQRREAFTEEARAYGLPTPRGCFIAGPPGCGKSLTAKAIATAWDMPLLRLNMGAVMAGLVGASEANLRKAIRTAETVAPCVLFIDEIDKSVGAGGGESDGNTTSRVRGEFLTWLQERTSEVFVVGSANNVEEMTHRAPELVRKGRWDELWFVDLPSPAEVRQILAVHLAQNRIDPKGIALDKVGPRAAGFSGAELEAVVKDSLYRAFADGKRKVKTEDLLAEIKRTVPLSRSSRDRIEALRRWAKEGRARLATPQAVVDHDDVLVGQPEV